MQRQRFPFVFTSDMAELLVAKSSSVESDASPGRNCLNMLQEFEELCGRAFNAIRVRSSQLRDRTLRCCGQCIIEFLFSFFLLFDAPTALD